MTHEDEVQANIKAMSADKDLQASGRLFQRQTIPYKYTYNFSWLGRPIIQEPQDMVAIQELTWTIKPDLIVEMGVAHGGSLMLSASMLALLDLQDCSELGIALDVARPDRYLRRVLGIDVDIRRHNHDAIRGHFLSPWISLQKGSSIDTFTIEYVKNFASDYKRVMLLLDSNHTHDHVLAELEAYAPLVSPGSYCVVLDTGIEDLPLGFCKDRPWGRGNNPRTAVDAYLENHPEFEVDYDVENKLVITAARGGYLRRK